MIHTTKINKKNYVNPHKNYVKFRTEVRHTLESIYQKINL
jgi:hypothetical protein